jgi:hypothetical protein
MEEIPGRVIDRIASAQQLDDRYHLSLASRRYRQNIPTPSAEDVIMFLYYDLYDKLQGDMNKIREYDSSRVLRTRIKSVPATYNPVKIMELANVYDISNLIKAFDFYDLINVSPSDLLRPLNYSRRGVYNEILILLAPKISVLDNEEVTELYLSKFTSNVWKDIFDKLPTYGF